MFKIFLKQNAKTEQNVKHKCTIEASYPTPLLGIDPKEMKLYVHPKTCTQKFKAILYLFFVGFFCFVLGPYPVAYGSSQARGQIGAVTTGLHHSHSNARSELHL